jgi:dihydrofolate synthase/folylpolyglutamate synthase
MDALGQPQNSFKSVHVAGTNGKGSTSHLLASIFAAAGYKTGLYTSPHLKDFRERIRINGKMIPQAEVVDFYMWGKCLSDKNPDSQSSSAGAATSAMLRLSENKRQICLSFAERERLQCKALTPPIQPSFFEMTTALAFHYFAKEKVDIAIIEAGMGGRLDSTNLITPELSLITNISLDHTQFLGDTIQKIAVEKAGIIKHGIPVVIGETQAKTAQVFIQKAAKENAPVVFADKTFEIEKIDNGCFNVLLNNNHVTKKIFLSNIITDLPLTTYQQKNFATVFCALNILKKNFIKINEENIRNGFANIIKTTGLQGRWQQLSTNPLIIADTGHNESGIKLTLKQVKATPHKNLHIVWGMVGDKDIERILNILPHKATNYFCCPPLPRGLNENELQKKATAHNLKGQAYKSIQDALQAAKSEANKNDMIYIGGSNFVVAEVI